MEGDNKKMSGGENERRVKRERNEGKKREEVKRLHNLFSPNSLNLAAKFKKRRGT